MKLNFIGKKNYLIFVFFVIFITLSKEEYQTIPMNFNFYDSQLAKFNIKLENVAEDDNTKCKNWIPSLFNPILLVHYNIKPEQSAEKQMKTINLPIFEEEIRALFYPQYLFLDKYQVNLFRILNQNEFNDCYFGLLDKIGDYPINDSNIFLNNMLEGYINKRIFSFGEWNIIGNDISSNFYFGDNHEYFIEKPKDGIIGICKVDEFDKYWGCIFNNMTFHNKTVDLKKENNEFYKIYFSSENFDVIFPLDFQGNFDNITENSCNYTEDSEHKISNLSCSNFFNTGEYELITLSDENMDISIEIDNLYRFETIKDEDRHKTRISYQNVKYFILPLSMFKKFLVQFNAEDKSISFYTNNSTILKLKNNQNDKNNNNGSSNGLKVFLIIFFIIILLILIFGIIWFIKKRRGNVEKNINKYNKFEDEENFQDMNEKRVF